jgi:small-conductance mechanosensitive channel
MSDLARERQHLERELERLRAELHAVEDAIEIQSFGFYEPRFGFESSKEYLARLKVVRDQQKRMVREKTATVCPRDWVVDGSLKKGREMMAEQTQLMLRAFNGDCDAAISSVKYDNVLRVEKRLKKSFDSINKLGSTKSISISVDYYDQKLMELHLVHEHREKVHEEKERQKEIREQMREEQAAQKEIDKAQKEAEKEETQYRNALEKARREMEAATEAQHEKLAELVAKLETELSAAIDRKAKSIARAQLTRSGHVYVLSNIGSFGDGIFKIGMTRRFEPLERVYELGDASVPFRFDVHAMIYSEDAPALEAALHREFEGRRVNRINTRREYFRVSLEEIAEAVGRHHGTITVVTSVEAEEYRKTCAIEEEMERRTRGLDKQLAGQGTTS